MQISVVSIFPQMFRAVTEYGVVGRAVDNELVSIETIDLRTYGKGAHRHLDDRPFGGGPGMVMQAQPVVDCISELKSNAMDDAPGHLPESTGKEIGSPRHLRVR